jgi:hypothetical protein
MEWTPPWLVQDAHWLLQDWLYFLESVTTGIFVMALVGFSLDSYEAYLLRDYQRFQFLAVSLFCHGPRFFRLLALVGTCYSYRYMWSSIRGHCTELVQKWGELILEVRP